jgi:hypothetical protein
VRDDRKGAAPSDLSRQVGAVCDGIEHVRAYIRNAGRGKKNRGGEA